MLHGGQRFAASKTDISHVADIEDAHAGTHGHVLVHDAASDRRRVFDGHVPAVEVDHLRAHLAMNGIQRSLANVLRNVLWDGGRSGFSNGQTEPRFDISWTLVRQWLGCRI